MNATDLGQFELWFSCVNLPASNWQPSTLNVHSKWTTGYSLSAGQR